MFYVFRLKQLLLLVVLTCSLASCKNCTLDVRYLLNNKDPIETSHCTSVQVSCIDEDNITLMVKCPHENAIVKIYFANDVKNILVVNMIGIKVRFSKYVRPHGEFEAFTGPPIRRKNSTLAVDIPREWLPLKVTRMSASVEVGDKIHNYYGIFNYGISIPDKMVVEEYKKLHCCLTELQTT